MILQYFSQKLTAAAFTLAWILMASSSHSLANSLTAEFQIKPFGPGDTLFLQSQQKLAKDMIYDSLLTRLTGNKEKDLRLLQQLVDRKSLRPDQRRELQALGSVLGQLLKKEFRLEWVVYVDQLGRSRGLQIDNTRQVMFPLTMISRRLEADARVDVQRIYDKASDIVRYTRANRPLFNSD
ncbi:MAG: DUF3806 domain-containing protein [Pseudomonadales bacterium]